MYFLGKPTDTLFNFKKDFSKLKKVYNLIETYTEDKKAILM